MHSEELPTKLKNEALSYQIIILKKYSFVDDHNKKLAWIDKLVEEIKSNDRWLVPALRLLRKIILLFEPNSTDNQKVSTNTNRYCIIEKMFLQINYFFLINKLIQFKKFFNRHAIITNLLDSAVLSTVVKSLVNYIKQVRELVNEETTIDLNQYSPDNWFNHIVQIQERLNFLRFFLKVI